MLWHAEAWLEACSWTEAEDQICSALQQRLQTWDAATHLLVLAWDASLSGLAEAGSVLGERLE